MTSINDDLRIRLINEAQATTDDGGDFVRKLFESAFSAGVISKNVDHLYAEVCAERDALEKQIAALREQLRTDRSEAVNLAENLLERGCKGVTERGVKVLCEAVLMMDDAIASV